MEEIAIDIASWHEMKFVGRATLAIQLASLLYAYVSELDAHTV
jgi:hypothetical protein